MKSTKTEIDEIKITEAITKCWLQDLSEYLDIEVAIVGSGPSGLVAGYYLAKKNCKVAIFEKRLSIGGGIWGGGMMFNKCVFQKEALPILDEFEINYKGFIERQVTGEACKSSYGGQEAKRAQELKGTRAQNTPRPPSSSTPLQEGKHTPSGAYCTIHPSQEGKIARAQEHKGFKDSNGDTQYYVADAIEIATKLAVKAIQSGVKIFNLMSVEDIVIRKEQVTGIVLNWTAVEMANLHVDPLSIKSKYLIDATGHDAEIAKIVVKKIGKKLFTKTGDLIGEKSMWAEEGEKALISNTKEIYNNLYVTGMAANAVFGSPRMGAIFGGMLMSGKKVAELILEIL